MALIDKVKVNIRLSATTFDTDEIQPLIDACKAELALAGVTKLDDTDPLIFRAIIYYCKGNFGFDDDGDRYIKAYEHLKLALAASKEYTEVVGDV